MSRDKQKNIYIFITDEKKQYYRAKQQNDGSYLIVKDTNYEPISTNPINLLNSSLEFGTNMQYNSMHRAINYPLQFIKDGAAILRSFYFNGKLVNSEVFVTIVEWNGNLTPGRYQRSFFGKVDFSQKEEDPKNGMFSVPLVDESAWAILSKHDDVEFAIDCSPTNPKAVKVLIDGITLLNRYTYQSVAHEYRGFKQDEFGHTIPLVLVSQDGDSTGIITKNSTFSSFVAHAPIPPLENKAEFFETMYPIQGLQIVGTYQFHFFNGYQNPARPYDQLEIYFMTSEGQRFNVYVFNQPNRRMVNNTVYTFNFNFTMDLQAGEKIYFGAIFEPTTRITPVVTNIKVNVKTRVQPQIVYGLRAGDLLQQLVTKATYGRYTIDSEYFNKFNKSICLSGDAIRGVPNAAIYTSFKDFFVSFDAMFWMALRSINGKLWMEDFMTVYSENSTLLDLGEAIDLQLIPAMEFYANSLEVGSPNVDLRHPSGRLEFNATNTMSMNIQAADRKLSIVSKYRLGCYDITFLILDYKGDSTEDNSGDKSVYVLDITDELSSALENIETFENITFNNVLLEPQIKSPLPNDVITNARPFVKGVAQPGETVNIYVDTIFSGSTVVDADGNWGFLIPSDLTSYSNIQSGEHFIEATFSDLIGAHYTVAITINTNYQTETKILYPQPADNLYNNKPLIKGVAQAGTTVLLSIDGVQVASLIADGSCKWEFKSPVLSNGNHTISVNGSTPYLFYVDSNVEYPLITYVGSELDGFVVVNNLPLIEGVSKPFEYVTIWLNYVSYVSLGTVQADANGNWSLQVVPTYYSDPLSNQIVALAPIQNGLNVISTSLDNHLVAINVTGYKLNRPSYQSITGVPDNSVFNTRFSPKHMLRNHYPKLAAILRNRPDEFVYFQKPGKNANLVTQLGTVITNERADIPTVELGEPFALLEYAKVRVRAQKTFIQTLEDFNKGGLITFKYRGRNIYAKPMGSMKIQSIENTEQEWKLLLSTKTSLLDLINLYQKGLNITIMQNALFHSDRNSLHFVEYNFQVPPKYQYANMYQDWFNNRNQAWTKNPHYVQKFQTTDVFRDQIITRGISNVILQMYRCSDASLVDTIQYLPVANPPINPPEVLLEAVVNLSAYPEDVYFFIPKVGELEVGISERIATKAKWPKTILIEASGSLNEVGTFWSTGFKTIIRTEGIIKKAQPVLSTNVSLDDIHTATVLSGSMTRKYEVRFGTARGLPDYLYMKIADAVALDQLFIENQAFAISEEEGISSSDDIEAHPLYYYTAYFYDKINHKGITVSGGAGSNLNGVVLVMDPTALGLPSGALMNIELENG